jgi:peptidoglycan/LPS O-acetylase OafA/YrhL
MPGLDAIRGLAALGVLLSHYKAHFNAVPLYPVLFPFYWGGGYLVDVFFVLSGFLLGRLYRTEAQWRGFLFKRIVRLFPLHWATLVVVTLLQRAYVARTGTPFVFRADDVRLFVLNLGLLQNVGFEGLAGFSFNGPSWSISVEWLVNLVFLALLFVPRRRVWIATALAAGAVLGLWMVNGRLAGFGVWGGVLTSPVLRGTYGFFVGVCLAELVSPAARQRYVWDVAGVACAALIVFLLGHPIWLESAVTEFGLVGVLTPALIASCSHGVWLARVTRWRPLVWLGDVSFSVYLWHFPIQIVFALLVARGWSIPYDAEMTLLIFVAVTYLVGDASWRWFEVPVQRRARRSRLARRALG